MTLINSIIYPRISVICVCLNASETIRNTLESVRAQKCSLELIVIDGGSDDATLDIVKEYDDIVGVLVSEPDGGIYDAMNKGIQLARGDILYFLNADDTFADDRVVADALDVLTNDSRLDLLFGDVIYITPNGPYLRRYEHVDARNLIYGDLCHQAVFTRRRLYEKFGMFSLDYPINADFEWFLRVFRADIKFQYIQRTIAHFKSDGWHTKDPKSFVRERMEVKFEYAYPLNYLIGEYLYRARRKLRALSGHPDFIPFT